MSWGSVLHVLYGPVKLLTGRSRGRADTARGAPRDWVDAGRCTYQNPIRPSCRGELFATRATRGGRTTWRLKRTTRVGEGESNDQDHTEQGYARPVRS